MSAAATGGPPPNRREHMPGDGPAEGSHASNGANRGAHDGRKSKNRVFPHIDDLVAAQPDVNALATIRKLLEKGESCAKQADTNLDFQRPDIALQEYIKASTIVVDLIPRHKDYPELKFDRGELHRMYSGLQKRISTRHEKFEEIKVLIKEDNAQSGVQPMASWGLQKDMIVSAAQHNGDIKSKPLLGATDSTQTHLIGSLDVHSHVGGFGRSSNATGFPTPPPDEIQSTRRKPPVQPKPDALHGRAMQPILPSHEKDLAARFSRLRGARPHSQAQDPRIRTQLIGMPEVADITTKRDSAPFPSPLANNTKQQSDRPLGPRDMPKAPTAPPKPHKVPLDVEILSMPKPPDAIYSPARNLDNPANLDMLRSGSRNPFGAPGKPPSIAPTSRVLRSTTAINGKGNHTASLQSLPIGGGSNTSLDHQLPDASTVTAEELFEYLKRGSHALSVLVVDIRDRGDFNDGHIMSHSIICIEPIVLRHGISAEELGQSLVLSPEAEQYLYETRDTFDLVVCYDQSSTSIERKVSGSPTGDLILGDFIKAVYDYGYEKQLKRPPRLLAGGLDAWVDLMGPRALESVQSLDATSTGAAKNHAKPFSSTPKSRQANVITARKAVHGARILSNEEQAKWKATLREKVAAISPDEVSYIRTTEDFFRRFPEPSAIQESMVSPSHHSSLESSNSQSQRLASAENASSGQGKSSLVPQIPTRPAPALPRQSYSGVSERTKYSSTTLASASPLEYRSKSTISGNRNAHCGLVNGGNTCYMSAVLQALRATRPLHDAIQELDLDRNLLPVRQGEGGPPQQLMISNLKLVFRSLSSGVTRYNPRELRRYTESVHIGGQTARDKFGGPNQQDASEYLIWLLDQLQTEFNYARARGPLLPLTASQEAVRLQQPMITSSWMQWQRFNHTNRSIITRDLFGQNAQSYTCRHCRFVQRSWETWSTLNVPIPDEAKGRVNILTMLDGVYGAPQELGDYRCDQCKRQGSTSQVRLTRCPNYLIIIIGRYEWQGNVQAKKPTPVNFPLDGLSLDRYHLSFDMRGSENLDPSFVPPFDYNCYAIVQHQGNTARAGHYIALVRETDPKSGRDVWLEYNDTIVTEVPDIQTRSQSNESFILFYHRQTRREMITMM